LAQPCAFGSDRLISAQPCGYAGVKGGRNQLEASLVCFATTVDERGSFVSILWIILIIVLVLLLLGFFSRGRW
jgi:hypothetical protein